MQVEPVKQGLFTFSWLAAAANRILERGDAKRRAGVLTPRK
jgi:hypothetical protein